MARVAAKMGQPDVRIISYADMEVRGGRAVDEEGEAWMAGVAVGMGQGVTLDAAMQDAGEGGYSGGRERSGWRGNWAPDTCLQAGMVHVVADGLSTCDCHA